MWFPNHITSVKDNWKIQCEFDYLSDKQNRISKNSPIFQWLGPFIWHHVKVSIKLAIKNYKFWTKWQCQTYAGTPIIYLLWLYFRRNKKQFQEIRQSFDNLFIYLFFYLVVCLFPCFWVTCLVVCLSIYLFISAFIYLFFSVSLYIFICLYLYLKLVSIIKLLH